MGKITTVTSKFLNLVGVRMQNSLIEREYKKAERRKCSALASNSWEIFVN